MRLNENWEINLDNPKLSKLINWKLINDLVVLKQYSYQDIQKFLEFLFYLKGQENKNYSNYKKYSEEEKNLIIRFLFENNYKIEITRFEDEWKIYLLETLLQIYNSTTDSEFKQYNLNQLKKSYMY